MLIVGKSLDCVDETFYSSTYLVPGLPTPKSSNSSSTAVFPTPTSTLQANFPSLPNSLILSHYSPDQCLLYVSNHLTYSLGHQLPRQPCLTSASYHSIGGQTRRHKWSRVSSLNMFNNPLESERRRGQAAMSSGLPRGSFMMLRRLSCHFCQKT